MMIIEFSFTVTMVTGNRKEVELLQSSAGQAELLTEARKADCSRSDVLSVVCNVLKQTRTIGKSHIYIVLVVVSSCQTALDCRQGLILHH